MNLLDKLIATVAPYTCLGCGAEGRLLCAACTEDLPQAIERCYRCHRLTAGAVTCPRCRTVSRLHAVQATCLYRGPAKQLIWKLKLAGARAATAEMVQHMLPYLTRSDTTIVVPVPTATGRARRRGYDQAELLARELARQAQLRYEPCLAHTTQSQQNGSSREQRVKQLMTAFRVRNVRSLRAEHVVLVDDVITTGATLEAAARTLEAAGVHRIDAVVFAQA